MGNRGGRIRRIRRTLPALAAVVTAAIAAGGGYVTARANPMAHSCPSDLSTWQATLGAEWIDCHQLSDLTTTNNPYTDTNSLTGMGFPPPGSGSLNSNKTTATTPPVSGLQIDGYFHDSCDAYQVEPAHLGRNGSPFIPYCTSNVTTTTCGSVCHHDAQFVIRIPDSWNGRLLTAGTPGIRDAFASDFILSDYAVERGWAYVSQDKGNMGANFYQSGCDETGTSCGASAWPGACTSNANPWCAGFAIAEWTYRMRQATHAARALLDSIASTYGTSGVKYSYASGISNGGYQTRRALETDTSTNPDGFGVLYDGGVDWEGTLFIPSLPAGVALDQPTTGWILFNYLPTTLANQPSDECTTLPATPPPATCPSNAINALAAVGFNPESYPLWLYHDNIYWGLTQKIYRLEYDPEFTNYTCSDMTHTLPQGCISPSAETVPPTDADASYAFASRESAVPAIATRIASAANTGDIKHPLITLQGDQDALLPIKTDSDLYAQMVHLSGHDSIFRYYVVRGGNHVDPQFDDHNGVDNYGNTLLRPILPCARSSLDALAAWVEQGVAAPGSHTIPRPANATASDLANTCDIGTLSANVPEGAPTVLMTAALAILATAALGLKRLGRRRRVARQ